MKKKTNDNPFVSRNRRRTAYLSLVVCLAILVTAGVAGAFHLTGIAKTYHAVLTCTAEPKHGPGYADFFVHTHNEDCYDENGNLWCTLPEIEAHEHDADCYTTTQELICTTPESEGHHHTADCHTRVRGDLTCELSTEPVYDEEGNLVAEGHVHTDACYAWNEELSCGKTEGEGAHHHGDACYQSVTKLTCKKPVVVLHTHDEECYTEDKDGNLQLTCGELEVTEHVHGEECFTVYEQDDDEPEETENEVPADGDTTDETPADGEDGFVFLFPEEEENENETGDDIVTDEVTTDEVTTDEVTTDEVTTDDVTTDKVTTDTTEEKQEEPAPEPETPPQSRSLGGERRGATVLAEIPDGVLNEYAKLELADYDADLAKATVLSKVNENAAEGEARDISAIYVIDIGFTAGGEAAFPNGEAPIRITLRANEIRSMTAPKLYHLYSGTAEQVKDAVFDTATGTVTFTSYGFSPFAVVELTGEDPAGIDMPAQNFHEWTDEIDVYVEADEGAFPAGTTMLVTAVPQEEVIDALNEAAPNAMVRNVQAVDITFYDAEGNEIEPATAIRVKMSKKTETPAPAAPAESTESVVMHVDNAGSAQIVENATVDNSTAEFESDSFSKYIFADLITEEVLDSLGNTYTVSVTYGPEAKIPENSGLEVSEILETSEEYREYVARTESALGMGEGTAGYIRLFDIKIEKDGEKIQPADGTTVDVKIELKDAQADSLSVVHFADESDTGSVVQSTETEGQTVSFAADGFSVYAVVDEGSTGDNARMTVEFYSKGTKIASMYVKNGDMADELEYILYDPGAGTLGSGELFGGWILDKPNGEYTTADISEAMTIDQVRTWAESLTITEGEKHRLDAAICKLYQITYKDTDGTVLGMDSVPVKAEQYGEDAVGATVKMAYTPKDDIHKFEGWTLDETSVSNVTSAIPTDRIYQNDESITIKGDVSFTVNAPEGNWLIFDENGKGGKYNAPQFVKSGQNTQQPCAPDDMTRKGYTFGGWYDTKEHADAHGVNPSVTTGQFAFDSEIANKTTLYASWIPNTKAPYTVILWTQNLNRDGYEVKASYVNNNGTVGQRIPYTTVENQDEDYVTGVGNNNGHYTGFCLTEGSKNQQVTITPEGDAVLNLYYDRIKYNFKFYLYRDGTQNRRYDYANNSGNGSALNDLVTWHSNQTAHPSVSGKTVLSETVGGRTYYYFVMEAYYGQDISSAWPKYDEITGANGREAVSFVMMVGTKLKPKATNQGSGTVKGIITVMDENILGATNNSNGNYIVIRFPDNYYNWRYHIWLETVDGEDYTGKTLHTHNGRTYYEETVLTVRSSNTTDANQNEPKYQGFDYVTRLGQNNGTWTGNHWTTTESGATLYHLNYIYNRQTFPITYFDGNHVNGNGATLENQASQLLHTSPEIPFGKVIADEYSDYKPEPQEGYVFEGWYLDEGCTVPYPWDTMPIGGIKVYAKWVQKEYRVFLHPNAGKDETLNWGSDNVSTSFRVAYGGKVSTPTGTRENSGYEFVGWYTDPSLSGASLFNADTELNDSTVTAEYDKTEPTERDKWGDPTATTNSDDLNDRFWITKKLDLYAKWRKILEGAEGINVVYTADDGKGHTGSNAPIDSNLYPDQAEATAQAADTAPEGMHFKNWVVQRWDSSANNGEGAYVDTDLTRLPGEKFTVDEGYAHKVQNPDQSGEYTYTIQLRAEYTTPESGLPTHIWWFENYSNNGAERHDSFHQDEGIQINEAINIPEAPIREGYTFLGWARIPTNSSRSEPGTPPTGKVLSLNENDLYLKYEDGSYKLVAPGSDYDGNVVTKVAADERLQYHDMYAVWQSNTIKVTKEIVRHSVDMQDINHTFYFALTKGDKTSFVRDDQGNIIVKEVNVVNGIPTPETVAFYELEDGDYQIWELDNPDGTLLSVGKLIERTTGTGNIMLSKIEGNNNASVSNASVVEKTMTNHYTDETHPLAFEANKKWMDRRAEEIPAPEGAEVIFGLYKEVGGQTTAVTTKTEEGKEIPVTITLDGTIDTNGETAAWHAKFDNLPNIDEEGRQITYKVKELAAFPAGFYPWLSKDVNGEGMGYYQYMEMSNGTIWNRQLTMTVRMDKHFDFQPNWGQTSYDAFAQDGVTRAKLNFELISPIGVITHYNLRDDFAHPHGATTYSKEVYNIPVGPAYDIRGLKEEDIEEYYKFKGTIRLAETGQESLLEAYNYYLDQLVYDGANTVEEGYAIVNVERDEGSSVPLKEIRIQNKYKKITNECKAEKIVEDLAQSDWEVQRQKNTFRTLHYAIQNSKGQYYAGISDEAILDTETGAYGFVKWSSDPNDAVYFENNFNNYNGGSGNWTSEEVTLQNAPVLPVGTYTIIEKEAAEGAINIPGYDLTVKNNTLTVSRTPGKNEYTGYNYKLSVTNHYEKKPEKLVSFKKVDIAHPDTVLPGAVFDLYKGTGEDKTPVRAGLYSNDQGYLAYKKDNEEIIVYELEYGAYQLIETDAPQGYTLWPDPITVTVGESGVTYDQAAVALAQTEGASFDETTNVYTIKIANNPGVELPSTGGRGTGLFTAIGAILSGTAGAILTLRKRKA